MQIQLFLSSLCYNNRGLNTVTNYALKIEKAQNRSETKRTKSGILQTQSN